MRKELERAGVAPSYGVMGASLFYVGAGLYFLQATHQYGYRVFDSAKRANPRYGEGRAENHRMVRALRELGGKWRNIVMVATAEQIGNREGRRLHGLATVTRDDLMEGREQPDPAVSGVTYLMNIHPVRLEGNPRGDRKMRSRRKALRYSVPGSCGEGRGGLLMAGRCISGDFFAHGSYRVTGYAVPMGETAGVAAALAARSRSCLTNYLGRPSRTSGARCAQDTYESNRLGVARGSCRVAVPQADLFRPFGAMPESSRQSKGFSQNPVARASAG
jgi:hypothetical protein